MEPNSEKAGRYSLRVSASFSDSELLLKRNSGAINFVKPGQTLKKEDLLLPRENMPLEHWVAVASLFTFFALFYILPLAWLAACYGMIVHRNAYATAVVAAFLVDLALPAGQNWQAFQDLRLWDIWRRYFRCCVILPQKPFLDRRLHYLLPQFPHACFPMAAFLTPVLAGDEVTGVPAPMYGVIASVLLQMPFLKHIFAWSACLPATEGNLLKLLTKCSVGMIPEGVAGIFEGASREHERIYIKARKGFVRVAIKAGIDLIPVYHLGNSQLLTYCGSESLSRKARMTIGFFWGWRGLPLPHQQPLITCLGLPITVEQADNPTQEQIDDTHARFVAALKELYNQHRHLLGWEGRDLQIR